MTAVVVMVVRDSHSWKSPGMAMRRRQNVPVTDDGAPAAVQVHRDVVEIRIRCNVNQTVLYSSANTEGDEHRRLYH